MTRPRLKHDELSNYLRVIIAMVRDKRQEAETAKEIGERFAREMCENLKRNAERKDSSSKNN